MAAVIQFPPKGEKPHLASIPDVFAPSPDNPDDVIKLAVSQSTIEKLVVARRRTDIFQAWAHLVGEMPPVNNAELVRRTEHGDCKISSLAESHACFKGVHRRYDQDDNGSDVYIYVIDTPYTVRWQSDLRTVAGIYPTPDGALLTVQVRSRAALHDCQEGIWGGITKWEFVNACKERTEYPEGFDNRYGKLVWHR